MINTKLFTFTSFWFGYNYFVLINQKWCIWKQKKQTMSTIQDTQKIVFVLYINIFI